MSLGLDINLIIIIVISVISIFAFSRPDVMGKLQFNAWQIVHRKEYYRVLSYGFVHGNWIHLLINMFVLYSFGRVVLYYFEAAFDGGTTIRYLILFLSAIVVSTLATLGKEKDNPHYNAVGASGAVSAVVFTSILFDPYNPILLFGIIPIPGIIFGVLYIIYSKYMAGKNIDNIGHDAHYYGALYGLVFPLLYEPRLAIHFFNQLLSFNF
ncbi:MAG: rhomboid family intrarane serine protease [Anaerophaga sp.]|uniref:rhomboid family intramembrane serine protease n=1 Tax=Anaerophaga thermohalophila TaxID=177400 RepID=UPI000237D3F9|nr:rhomboid family intramembrane serine protease [Anaerophaga thermohalophila]MBZ4677068.1 rhomboid family intrarane serine protease [Anaerophaga sp.]